MARHCETNQSSAFAYFFFDGKDGQKASQTVGSLIRSLIRQFSTAYGGVPAVLTKLYHSCHSSSHLNDILVGMLHVDWRRRMTLPEIRRAIEAFDDFHSDGSVFEGSVARCSLVGFRGRVRYRICKPIAGR